MNRMASGFLVLLAAFWCVHPAAGDGGFFYYYYVIEGETADLAQTRQEVLLGVNDPPQGTPGVTYVLRTQYQGSQEEFAWVVPIPDTPTDVVSHDSDDLFVQLDDFTRPRFSVLRRGRGGGGCACGAAGGGGGTADGVVEVEAAGQAGVFDWTALTSTGSGSLLDWLNDNGFAVPQTAADVLDTYILDGRHFLAIRVREPAELDRNSAGDVEIPPIQFTCETEERFYPIAISRISAADETEVLVYVYGDHRAEAANLANVVIDPDDVRYMWDSPSKTNYEVLVAQAIAENGGHALITEYAQWVDVVNWPERPVDLDATYLTRLRTVIAREDMTLDFAFQRAISDATVDNYFSVGGGTSGDDARAMVGKPLAALLILAAFRRAMSRRGAWHWHRQG